MNILIIEDEIEIAMAIGEYVLNNENTFDIAGDLLEARKKIYESNWDCIVLDIGLPSGSGLELMNEVRNIHPSCIVIILSAKNSDLDKIHGLEYGADDYMTKPFNLAELNARIKAIHRRLFPDSNKELVYNGLRLNEMNFEVYYHQQKIDITRIEFYILRLFLSNVSKVISKTTIIENIWREDAETISSEEILYSHMKNIRKKLALVGESDIIKTVYGIGYKLE